MTEEYIKRVKDYYKIWCDSEKTRINNYNLLLKSQKEKNNKIHLLLEDEKVREFAELINFNERKITDNYLQLDISLKNFLSSMKFEMPNISEKSILKNDKYPIFCYVKSLEPTGDEMVKGYYDVYFSLECKGYGFGPSDRVKDGMSRELFKEKYDIIYAPKGKTFTDNDTFYSIQSEFVEEALKTNQENAKKLILSRYGKNNN